MNPLDVRAKRPRKFRLGVRDIAEAAGVQPSVVFYNKVDIGNLVEVSEFVVGMRMVGRFKEKRNEAATGGDNECVRG